MRSVTYGETKIETDPNRVSLLCALAYYKDGLLYVTYARIIMCY